MSIKDQKDDQEIGPAGEKLQKVLARIGVGSRRDVEAWISHGRIKVNGKDATLGQRVDMHDAITIDGKVIKREEAAESVRRVIMYNKPDGEICTRLDPEGRPTVFDKMPRPKEGRWINIGRLDINTTGLLMFTTDGELANRLMHPSYEMDREYAVRVRGEVDDEMIERLKAGVVLEDGPAKFTDIKQAPGGEGFNHWYHCVVMEGRNREVRRLWESQGLVVSRLKRVRFGPVFLNSDLPMGRWREMSQYEVDILSAEVGLTPVAMPQMNAKSKDKLERMQRKSSRPMGKTERVRSLRPAIGNQTAATPRDYRVNRKSKASVQPASQQHLVLTASAVHARHVRPTVAPSAVKAVVRQAVVAAIAVRLPVVVNLVVMRSRYASGGPSVRHQAPGQASAEETPGHRPGRQGRAIGQTPRCASRFRPASGLWSSQA